MATCICCLNCILSNILKISFCLKAQYLRVFLRGIITELVLITPLQWRNNGHEGVSNHQPRHCLLNRLFRRRSQKTSKLRVTGLCAGNSPVTGEFTAQMASNAENVSIWWRHHAKPDTKYQVTFGLKNTCLSVSPYMNFLLLDCELVKLVSVILG